MRVNLKEAQRVPGQPVAFDLTADFAPLQFAGDPLIFPTPVHAHGQAVGQGDLVLVTGQVDAVVEMPCNRCATPFTQTLHAEFDEEYAATVDADHPDRFPLEGDATDLTPMLLANLLLALPSKNLCRPDCAGLCPICGADLSRGDCGCAPPPSTISTKNPLHALGELLTNKEV